MGEVNPESAKSVSVSFKMLDGKKVDDAISHVCDYFKEQGLTLLECWHVCHCIEHSALGIMGVKAEDVLKEAGD